MDKNTISVIVESLPSDVYTQILPWATGIILPIALFFVSKTFASKAENNANEFTIKLYKEERAHLQKNRAIDLLNEIYKFTFRLKRVNVKRKRSEELGKSVLAANDKIIESKNEQAISYQQENLRVSFSENSELEDLQVEYIINIHSIVGQLSTIIGDEIISGLADKVEILTEKAQDPGTISQENVESITSEINSLSDRIISGEIEIVSV